jgi:hypothetical protein
MFWSVRIHEWRITLEKIDIQYSENMISHIYYEHKYEKTCYIKQISYLTSSTKTVDI